MSGLRVRAVVAARGLDLDLTLGDGEVVALMGPNGAGKSTVLDVVAGLLRPDSGHVGIDSRVLLDTASGAWTPAARREVGLLRQEPLLFPHLSVLENVAFGPRSQGMSKDAARARAADLLTDVGAGELAPRRPDTLSGGQAQRVAIARALAPQPRALLLDEPTSALDAEYVASVRLLLASVLASRKRYALIVTHDPLDALMLADRLVVLERGRVVEQGPPRELLTAPRSAHAARLAGQSLLRGAAAPGGLVLSGTTPAGATVPESPDAVDTTGDVLIMGDLAAGVEPGAAAVVALHPRALRVTSFAAGAAPGDVAASQETILAARLTAAEPHAGSLRLHLGLTATGGATITVEVSLAEATSLDLTPGAALCVRIPRSAVVVRAG